MPCRPFLCSIALAALLATACSNGNDRSPLVAVVYGHELHRSDLDGLVGEGVASEDSATIVDNYIEQWIRQTVILSKAEKNITDNFDRQLRDYKNSLITYAYEQQIVSQLLDTIVTQQQVADYYESHREDFRLRYAIVKAVYVAVPAKSPSLAKMKGMMYKQHFEDSEVVALEEAATQAGLAGSFDAVSWIPFHTLQRAVPVTTTDEDSYLRQHKTISVDDGEVTYLARIIEYKPSGDISPIELQSDNIRSLILNHRKSEILQHMQADLLNEAENSDNVKRYL
ncbi:MAG: hypothetical protein IJ760_08275 [Bacteroidales bacterium]|nr:hypothetical protein [Bacteroidales bacterium]